MSDLAAWKVHGPVRSLNKELAEWDEGRSEWKAPRNRTTAVFRPDGQLIETVSHNPDGSIVRQLRFYDDAGRLLEEQWQFNDTFSRRRRYSYDAKGRPIRAVDILADGIEQETETYVDDEAGRKSRRDVIDRPRDGVTMTYGVDGAEGNYAAPDAAMRLTMFDDNDLPIQAMFHDAAGVVVMRVELSRDADGRVLSEIARSGGGTPWPGLTPDRMPQDERAEFMSVLSTVFADGAFTASEYAYDRSGRVVERTRRIGTLSDERTTFQYDDRGNSILEITQDRQREVHVDDGTVQYGELAARVHEVRFEYRYDDHGNWTERVVWRRTTDQPDFRRSNAERRIIAYYDE